MTEKIILAVADAISGEYTKRELEGAELTAYLEKREELEKEAAEKAKAKEDAKAALLEKLGITAEEAILLLSAAQSTPIVAAE
jgi:hypothetical protein